MKDITTLKEEITNLVEGYIADLESKELNPNCGLRLEDCKKRLNGFVIKLIKTNNRLSIHMLKSKITFYYLSIVRNFS